MRQIQSMARAAARRFDSAGTTALSRYGALLVALALLPTTMATAAPGDLDPRFSGDGIVTTDFGGDDYSFGVALQPNRRIVTAGYAIDGAVGVTRFALARYRRSGQLDATFGGDGRVTIEFGGMYGNIAVAQDVAIQPDGKIIAAGSVSQDTGGLTGAVASSSTPRVGLALTRLLPDGSLDHDFGDGGLVVVNRGNARQAYAVALQPDGKIVVAGLAVNATTSHSDFALLRFRPNGRLDASFGNQGVVVTDFGGPNDFAQAIALQSDGRIIAAGRGDPTAGQLEFAVARYRRNGTLDPTFDSDGRVTTSVPGDYFGTAVALQADGKIVAAGQASGSGADFALVRYHANGALDLSFDGDGQVTADLGGVEYANDLVLQGDGKIVVAGSYIDVATFQRSFALARFLPDGILDTTFSGTGFVITQIGAGADAIANAVTLQPNGKIVAAGQVRDDTGVSDFGLTRYLGDDRHR